MDKERRRKEEKRKVRTRQGSGRLTGDIGSSVSFTSVQVVVREANTSKAPRSFTSDLGTVR
jgi:hypothetical protein